MTNAGILALSAALSWIVATYQAERKLDIELRALANDVEKTKIGIIDLIKDRDISLAIAIIDYYQARHGREDEEYASFLDALSKYIASSPATLSSKNLQPIAPGPDAVSTATIQAQFQSSNRRRYAEELVESYRSDATRRPTIVAGLISSIMQDDKGSLSRYRINLYVALTFSLLPRVDLRPEDARKLAQLKSTADYNDATFQANVDRALAKQLN